MSTQHKPDIQVIVADDHPIFRDGMESAISQISFVKKVEHADNGRKVLKLLDQEFYEIVFMDIRMPEMDGIETTRQIIKKHAEVKVIGLSMHDDREHISEMFNTGAHGYLLKNTTQREIELAMIEVLSGDLYYSEEVSKILRKRLTDKQKEKLKTKELIFRHDRMKEVLFLLCKEFNTREIGDILCLSEKTIEGYRAQLLKLTNARNLVGVIMFAIKNGVMDDLIMINKFNKLQKKNS